MVLFMACVWCVVLETKANLERKRRNWKKTLVNDDHNELCFLKQSFFCCFLRFEPFIFSGV
jgi:hypothetical protein